MGAETGGLDRTCILLGSSRPTLFPTSTNQLSSLSATNQFLLMCTCFLCTSVDLGVIRTLWEKLCCSSWIRGGEDRGTLPAAEGGGVGHRLWAPANIFGKLFFDVLHDVKSQMHLMRYVIWHAPCGLGPPTHRPTNQTWKCGHPPSYSFALLINLWSG